MLINRALTIPKDTTDVRAAMKRLLWLRGMSSADLATATRLSDTYWKHRLGANSSDGYKIHPGIMDRFLDAIDATPAERRRLHLLGALEAGWKLENTNADA